MCVGVVYLLINYTAALLAGRALAALLAGRALAALSPGGALATLFVGRALPPQGSYRPEIV